MLMHELCVWKLWQKLQFGDQR